LLRFIQLCDRPAVSNLLLIHNARNVDIYFIGAAMKALEKSRSPSESIVISNRGKMWTFDCPSDSDSNVFGTGSFTFLQRREAVFHHLLRWWPAVACANSWKYTTTILSPGVGMNCTIGNAWIAIPTERFLQTLRSHS
jgi:hypothetical protein